MSRTQGERLLMKACVYALEKIRNAQKEMAAGNTFGASCTLASAEGYLDNVVREEQAK